jgi:hypothetical protein
MHVAANTIEKLLNLAGILSKWHGLETGKNQLYNRLQYNLLGIS